MTHPTCAPARHPDPLHALSEAHCANTCLRRLASLAQKYRNDEHFVTWTEIRSLAAVVNAEYKRRLRAVQARIGATTD
jgi:hypothetical protein